MIEWKRAKDTPPKNNQDCFITSKGATTILGPIVFNEKIEAFVDFFATYEAGAMYSINSDEMDLWWCDVGEINLPGDEEETNE